MAAAWEPNQEGISQLVALLAELQNPGSNQAQVLERLNEARRSPEFCGYLVFIFARGESLPIEVRQAAGLLLKNALPAGPSFAQVPQVWSSIQACLLGMLGHESRPLRHTAGTCLVSAAGMVGLSSWPALVACLAQGLEPGAGSASTEGALDTLYKLMEEQPVQLEDRGPDGTAAAPNNTLLPRVLTLFGHGDADLRASAVRTLNLAASNMPGWLVTHIDDYLRGLFALAHDAAPAVRRDVCFGLVQALVLAPDRLQGSLPDLIEYMLSSNQDGDEGVAIESCEFWSTLCDSVDDTSVLRPFLPRLLPVLLRNMVFEEHSDEVAEAEAAEEEARSAASTRQEESARPFVGRTHARAGGADGEEEDDDEEEEISRWNLRRCSASALDMLSTVFGEELLPIILPPISQRLAEPDWRAQEAAILALGAISQGCTGGLAAHLQNLITLLLPATTSPRPMVRCIACWALARYSRWLFNCTPGSTRGSNSMASTVVQTLAARLADRNWVVQKAVCGSLATLVELGGDALPSQELGVIAAALAGALRSYGRRTLRHVYDAIATLAEQIRGGMADPVVAGQLVPELFTRLTTLPDSDPELLPLLECLTAVTQAAGHAVEPWTAMSFTKCVHLIAAAEQGLKSGAVDPDEAAQVIVCALDYVAALAEGLGSSIESLVSASPIIDLILAGTQQASPVEMRQSAFAAVGDLARACSPHLVGRLAELASGAVDQLAPESITQEGMAACNNAAWSMGELSVRCRPEHVSPGIALPLLERYAAIIASPPGRLPRSLRENAAIALGRLTLVVPGIVKPHLAHFLAPWCSTLAGVRDGEEKDHAVLGLCALLRQDAQAALPAFSPLCAALASWHSPNPESQVQRECAELARALKATLEAQRQWETAVRSLTPAVAQKLQQAYGI